MPAITYQKYEMKKAIFALLDRYLELYPDRSIDLAKGLAQREVSRMTLQELKNWRQRIQDAVHAGERGETCVQNVGLA